MKYIGARHSYIRHTLFLFNPTNLDEVCVQATHIERSGKNVQEDHTKNPSKFQNNNFKGKGKGKKTTTTNKEEGKSSCTHFKKHGHDDEHCWKLHPELRPNKFGVKGKPKIVAIVQKDSGSYLGDEMRITTAGVQGKVPLMLVQVLQFHILKLKRREVKFFTSE
jgi:hypothetical protein